MSAISADKKRQVFQKVLRELSKKTEREFVGFKYQPIGRKGPKDILAQAMELPIKGVLILGVTEAGSCIMQDANLNVLELTYLSSMLQARMNLVAQQVLQNGQVFQGPEDFK